MARRLGADDDHQPAIAQPTFAASPSAISASMAADASSTSPAAPPIAAIRPQHWHYAASKAGMIGMTKIHRARLCGENILCLRGHARFHRLRHDRRIIWQGRGGAKILADIPLGRVASTDEVAEVIRWLATEAPASATGIGDRRQWSQLCPLKSALLLAAQSISIPLGHPRVNEQPRAPIDTSGPLWAAACDETTDRNKAAPPVRIHANSYLVGTCGLSSMLIVGEQGDILIDGGESGRRGPHRRKHPARLAIRHPDIRLHPAQRYRFPPIWAAFPSSSG